MTGSGRAQAPRLPVSGQLRLALFWFGISFVWGALTSVALPFLLVPAHPGASNPVLVNPAQKNTALGVLETAGLLLAIVVQPAAGAFSDRLRTRWGRRRPMIALGALGAVAALLVMAGVESFLVLVAIYCVLQFVMNVAQGAYQGLLPDTVPASQRGRASGWLGIATLTGQVAGAIAAGPLAPRTACDVIAVVVLLSAAITVFGVHEPRLPEPERAARTGSRLAALRGYVREIGAQRDFCLVVLSRFLMYLAFAGIQKFAAYFISDTFRGDDSLFGFNLGGPQTATSAMLAVVVLFGIAVTYPAVRLSDRVGRRSVLVTAALLGAAACASFVFARSVTEVVLFALPLAFAFGMIVSVDWAFMADLAPPGRAGTFLGFSNLATAGSQAAPVVLGPVIDVVNAHSSPGPGVPGTAGYDVVFVVGAIAFLAGALVLLRVRSTRVPRAPEFALT